MTVKKAEDRVLCAKNQIKNAEEELARAQIDLAKAQVVPAALETLKSLKATSHQVWQICDLKAWDDESKALYSKAQAFEDELAVLLLGAGERVQKLNKLDPERWPLEGALRIRPGGFPTDKDAADAISTMIFDRGFGCGSNTAFDELSDKDKDRWNDLRNRAVDLLGQTGAEGFELWRQGRHDT